MLKPVKITTGWTLLRQLEKVREEYAEVELLVLSKELGKHNITALNIAEELIDLQTACETMLYMLGLTEAELNTMREYVVLKNKTRGYFN